MFFSIRCLYLYFIDPVTAFDMIKDSPKTEKVAIRFNGK